MAISVFNIVVKKILKNKNKIIEIDKIKKIINNIMDDAYSDNKAYKIIYNLKNKWYLISIKKDIFFVKSPKQEIQDFEIIDKNYWDVLKKQCNKYCDNERYIWWIKALEINMQIFSIPDNIDIVNQIKQSNEIVLVSKEVNFKKYKSNRGVDVFKEFKKNTQKQKIWKYVFKYANLELSLLETLYNPNILDSKYNTELIKKSLKKFKKILNYSNLQYIISLWKHHSSINRLYKISLSLDNKISDPILNIIKKESYFLDL